MKKHTAVTLLTAILVVLGATVYGQQRNIKTETDSKWQMWYGGGPRIIKTYSFYYNDNDDKVLHGSYTEKSEYGGGDEMSYSFNATYKDGKLDGLVKLKFYELKSGLWNYVDYIYLDLSANFSNGIPCGTWKLSKDGWTNKKTAMKKPPLNAKKTEVTFVDGKIAKYVSGNEWVTFNNGEVAHYELEDKGVKIKDGYALEFLRKNGDHSPLSEEQKQLIDNFESGKITKEELIRKGYVLEEKEFTFDGMAYISRSVCDGWTSHNADLSHGVSSYMGYANLKYFILKKIQTEEATLEQCLKYCNNATYDDAKIERYNSLMENSYFNKTQGYGKDEVMHYYLLSESVKAQLTEAMSPLFLPKYNQAVNFMNGYKKNNSEAITAYSKAAEIFEGIPRFKDSKEKGEYCRNKIVEIANDVIKDAKARLDQYEDSTGINAWFASKNAKEDLESLSWMVDDELDFMLFRCNEMSEKTFKSAYDEVAEKIDYLSQTKSVVFADQFLLDKCTLFITFLQEAGKDEKRLVKYLNIPQGQYLTCNNGICLDDKSLGYLNKSKAFREKIEKGMARVEYLEKKLNKTLYETTEISKKFKPEKIDFYSSSPANYYNNFDFNGCPINNQYKTYTEARVLDTALAMFCPMVDYRIISVTIDIISGYFFAECEIDKKLPGKIGDYETYSTYFLLTYNGEISVRYISPKYIGTDRVRNKWDELKDNDGKILAKSKVCKNIVSAYSKYMKTAETSTIENLKAIIANQEKILKAINSSNAVELDNKVKKLKDKSIESVIKAIQ